jgi:hypothetical protein
MGDWYEFGFIVVDGEDVAGAIFQNKDSGYRAMEFQLTEAQKLLVNEWVKKQQAIENEKDEMIKSFITEQGSYKATIVNYN